MTRFILLAALLLPVPAAANDLADIFGSLAKSAGQTPAPPTFEQHDDRPILECLVQPGGGCPPCNWWKSRGDEGLPFQLEFIESEELPPFGYPTFKIPGRADNELKYIGNPSCDDRGVEGVVKRWRMMTGEDESEAVDAAQSPTPYHQIIQALELADFKKGETFEDIGCGDGRALILAAEHGASRVIGIEIDEKQASLAELRVSQAGFAGKAEIITADATEIDLPPADVAFVYLYPGTLSEIKDQLTTKFDRVVSYMHQIPGLPMTKRGDLWLWKKSTAQQVQETDPVYGRPIVGYRPYAIYGGWKYYSHCCGNMSCPMGQEIMRQLNSRQNVEPIYGQAATPQPQVHQRQSSGQPRRQVRYCRNCGR